MPIIFDRTLKSLVFQTNIHAKNVLLDSVRILKSA